MAQLIPLLALMLATGITAYLRLGAKAWTALAVVAMLAASYSSAHWVVLGLCWIGLAGIAVLINTPKLRQRLITTPFLAYYQSVLPQLSETEQVALEAGTVGFEGELFSGKPDFNQLLKQPAAKLSAEEQAFVDGPVDQVCQMTNDWVVTHQEADLPTEVWEYIKRQKFFGMIIPKEFGGLGFSAFAHSVVLQKLNSHCPTLGTTVAVPNSLGPAELLLHYGSEEQKNFYLPRLADGREIPCFGLTNTWAGSDATSIPDVGIVCKQMVDGVETLGLKLTVDKRYITLAPVATVIGLAFRLYDPDKLLSDVEDRGITLALVPRETKGLEIGRRHAPLNVPFQNGPVRAKNMFVPLSTIIGGEKMVGQGWRMLVECLSVGRAISLPSGSAGGARIVAAATGAYARIRKQFGLSIGRFEGVEEALARIGGHAYTVTALAQQTANVVDLGEKPSVPSAIAKYHATELARSIVSDAMDVQAGKAVILGPKNFVGRMWQGAPISITVEGANILTRSMIIFGQGAIRCHPYVLKEMRAAALPDATERLQEFDKLLFGHIGFAISNAVRAFWFGLTGSYIGTGPGDAYTRRFYRKLNRYSAALALLADLSMLTLGGRLKFKERLSGRLGDVLSQLYIASSVLKRYEDQGRPVADRPLLAWSMYDCIYKMQLALVGALRNYPYRPIAWGLGLLLFPLGQRERAPGDRTAHKVAQLLMSPNEARDRLMQYAFTTNCENSPAAQMIAALPEVIAAEPIERRFEKAKKSGVVSAHDWPAQLEQAIAAGVVSAEEAKLLDRARTLTLQTIMVDDFDPIELRAEVRHGKPAAKPLRVVA